MDLRGKVSLVGAAESDLGKVATNTSHLDLIGQATMRALDDAGLNLSDVDGEGIIKRQHVDVVLVDPGGRIGPLAGF